MQVNNILNIRKGIKATMLFFLSITLFSCIEEFEPDINDSDNLLVISGSIIKGDSIQEVNISNTRSYNQEEYDEVATYKVWVENDKGQQFYFTEKSSGNYEAVIADAYLSYNSQFKLRVSSEDGKEYESSFETIQESPPVDTVYYQEEAYQSSSEEYDLGLQFYVDLKAAEDQGNFYRWKLEETWEYRSSFVPTWFWDTELDLITRFITDTNIYYCWSTEDVEGLYSATTENLIVNEKKMIPLNYVAGSNLKTKYAYSLLIKQYVLSEVAYEYWDRNKIQTSESGSLYETQPSQTKSNITNINDPSETILGFFWASSYSEKRVFFDGPLGTNYLTQCTLDTVVFNDEFHQYPNPTYYLVKISTSPVIYSTANDECFDCREKGGTNIKPSYMP
jgi:hypothetical protein